MNQTPTDKLNPSSVQSPLTPGWVTVGVLLMGLLGCAHKRTIKGPDLILPIASCEPQVTLHNCDVSQEPPKCAQVAVKYTKGCEQIKVQK